MSITLRPLTWGVLVATPLLVLSSWRGAPQDPVRKPPAQFPSVAVDGRAVDWERLGEKSVLVAFFSMRMQGLVPCLQSFQEVYEERREANLEVIGVSIDSDNRHGLRAFLDEQGFTFPVLVDPDRTMLTAYRPTAIPQAYFFAEQGRYLGDLPGFPEEGSPTPAAFYTNLLRRAIGLDVLLENDPSSIPWPEIPSFAIPQTDISRDSLRGTSYVLAFVAADCDRCREELEFFRTLHLEFADQGLEFVTVLVSEGVDPQRFRRERRLPFPVYTDEDGTLRHTLHYRGFVPDTLIVDGSGRIRYRHTAFDEEQPPLYRMEIRRVLGLENPPILKRSGPSGVRRCTVCHEREYFDWRATGHARAMRSLQAIGAAGKPECVRCHVVGWDQPGGFNSATSARTHLLGDVQCESCHGNGGPHLARDGEPYPVTAEACASCHDEEHSLAFDFDKFVGLVDHSRNLFDLSGQQREEAAALREEQRRALLEPDGAYVGAADCRECHPSQFDRWQGSPHAQTLGRLSSGERGDATCLRCHTTGFERQWSNQGLAGPSDGMAASVQCEACHGPGDRHTAAGSPAELRETIIGLGDRCPECVIRQICVSCHDQTNDPEFDLKAGLLAVRRLCSGGAGHW
jgi:peroxiredoxin